MTDPIAAPSSLVPQCFSEVYCADLPSSCNIYLSGKRCIKLCTTEDDKSKTNDTKLPHANNVPMMRYATERHSIILMKKDKHERGDGYSLSTIRLMNSKNNEKEKVLENNVDVCLAHSSTSWDHDASMGDSSLEVFAMMRNTSDVQNTDDTTDKNTLATADVGTNDSTTPAAGDGTSEQKSSEAAAVSNITPSLKDELDSGDDLLPQYYLMVNNITRMKSINIETIPLDFRPVAVHVAELYISKDSDNIDTTCFGIFVASVDDNILRLYVTTKGALQKRVEHGRKNDGTCFKSVSLYDISESGVQVQDDLDEGMNDPLTTLSTPIMAIDTCLTVEEEESGDMRLNRLALACYDGTVRILAYQLKAQQTQENVGNSDHDIPALQLCHVRCSSFIIDGPVVSLHFGTSCSANTKLPQTPSLFLVAGSLCGFACIFYESLMADNEGKSARFFNGPTTLVDGLYDAQQEGYEDSVTSVHCYTGNHQMIVVGTQGGRVLLFQQCQQEKSIWEGRLITVQKEQYELMSQIDQNKNEISRLQSEKEMNDSNEVDLSASISEMQCKLEDMSKEINELHTECCESPDKVDEPKDEECLDKSAASIEHDPEPTQKFELNTSPDAPRINDISTLKTKIEASQMELTSLQRKQQTNVLKIAELTSETDECTRTIEQNKKKLDGYKLHPGRYRYKLLCEYHLPYPIHGISSTSCDESKRQEIFVTTRRSFHVFQYSPGNI